MRVSTNYKSFAKALPEYNKMRQSDQILTIKEFEALGKFFGKKGAPLKSKTRSEKAKREFNEALKAYNKRFGTGGRKRLEREAKKQNEKIEKSVAKKKGLSQFEQVALREVQKRREAIKAFASVTVSQLRDKLNIGSDVIQYLATEKGFTSKMIESYIRNMERAYAMLTPKAREKADSDVMAQAMKDLADYYGSDGLASALEAYLKGVDRGEVDETLDAFDFFFSNETEAEKAGFTFDDFLEIMDSYEEWNYKNFEEAFETLKEREV